MPSSLVRKVDSAAKQSFQSRSAYIRQALVEKLRYEGEAEIPNTISDEAFRRAQSARTLKAINQMLHKQK